MVSQASSAGYFWLRRLYLFSGFVFAFAFIICLLLPFSMALGSADTFNLFAEITEQIPLLDEFEVICILLPLLFHAAVGLSIIYASQFNIISYGTYGNWIYALQRLAGIFLIVFVGYHIYFTRFVFAFTGHYADFAYMHKLLEPAWAKVFYCLGFASSAFYIGSGVWTALLLLGITATKKSQEIAAMLLWILTFAIAGFGIRLVYAF